MKTRLSGAVVLVCGLGGVGGCSADGGHPPGMSDDGGASIYDLSTRDLASGGGGGSGGAGGSGGSGGGGSGGAGGMAGGDMASGDFWDAPPIPVAHNVMTF